MGLFGKKKNTMDMTEGNILKILITFAVPLFLGQLFQQLYNTVDTYVVGNYVSNDAFAAVGNTGPIINTLIGLFAGFSTGAGVVISQYFGAKQYENVRKAVNTTVLVTILLGIVFTFIGIAIVPFMLTLMKTPDEVFEEAKAYLMNIFEKENPRLAKIVDRAFEENSIALLSSLNNCSILAANN